MLKIYIFIFDYELLFLIYKVTHASFNVLKSSSLCSSLQSHRISKLQKNFYKTKNNKNLIFKYFIMHSLTRMPFFFVIYFFNAKVHLSVI